MTILIGGEAEGAINVSPAIEKGYATKRAALKTGKLHALALKVSATSKATKVRLGIRKDEAGAVGAFIAETAELTFTTETAETKEGTLEGGDVELTNGTVYWLCWVIDAGGTGNIKCTEKAGFGFKTTAAIKLINKGTWTVAENKFGEPAPIWGIETAAGTVTAQCKGNVVIIGNEGVAQQNQAKATGQVVVADSVHATMIAQAQAQAKEQFMTQVSSQQRISAGVVAQYSFKDKASVEVMSKVQAITRLQFIDSAVPQAMMQAKATAKILIASNASAQQVQQAAGKARLVFAGEAHTKATQESSGKKVAIFIFED